MPVTWDTTFEGQPANSEDRSIGAERIRDLKLAVSERADAEHNWGPTGSTNSGDHIEGSGKAFYRDANVTNRCTPASPQGVYNGVALGANDVGRMQFRTSTRGYQPMVWDGAAWRNASGYISVGASTTTNETAFDSTVQVVLLNSGGGADWEFGPGALASVDTYVVKIHVAVCVQALGNTRHIGVQLQRSSNGGGVWATLQERILTLPQNDTGWAYFSSIQTITGGPAVDVIHRVRLSTSDGVGANVGKANAVAATPTGMGSLSSYATWEVWMR